MPCRVLKKGLSWGFVVGFFTGILLGFPQGVRSSGCLQGYSLERPFTGHSLGSSKRVLDQRPLPGPWGGHAVATGFFKGVLRGSLLGWSSTGLFGVVLLAVVLHGGSSRGSHSGVFTPPPPCPNPPFSIPLGWGGTVTLITAKNGTSQFIGGASSAVRAQCNYLGVWPY